MVTKKPTRSRAKKVIWFNPPYSLNVKTNVGREFLMLVDKHFPVGHPLHKYLNRNTIKVSYRCLPNMGQKLANHNAKVLRKELNPAPQTKATCNCQNSRKAECPMPGECCQSGAIYQATVSTSDGRKETYVGLAKQFKKRYLKHRATLKNRNSEGHTTLSNYVWEQREKQKTPTISWKYLEKNVPDFNPITGICKLCTREKYQIVFNPSVASLNHRTEIFSHCRHKQSYLLGDPPD